MDSAIKIVHTMPSFIQKNLQHDTAQLSATLALDTSTARIEVQCLLQHALQVSRAYLIAHPEYVLSDTEQTQYSSMLQRRLHGEPLAYILGGREFFGLNFQVNSATLIPRADTELLVEKALQIIPKNTASNLSESIYSVLDLGTGSGAIALSIAHHRPHIQVVACDFSADALQVARENARHLNLNNIIFTHSDWYAALGNQHFDLIVSNPPYIAADDPHLQMGDLRFEPYTALAAGADGLQDIRQIIAGAHAHLKPQGQLWLEHGYNQAASVREILQQAGLHNIYSERDLAGIERISGATLGATFGAMR